EDGAERDGRLAGDQGGASADRLPPEPGVSAGDQPGIVDRLLDRNPDRAGAAGAGDPGLRVPALQPRAATQDDPAAGEGRDEADGRGSADQGPPPADRDAAGDAADPAGRADGGRDRDEPDPLRG